MVLVTNVQCSWKAEAGETELGLAYVALCVTLRRCYFSEFCGRGEEYPGRGEGGCFWLPTSEGKGAKKEFL